jgi:acyl carrier protein
VSEASLIDRPAIGPVRTREEFRAGLLALVRAVGRSLRRCGPPPVVDADTPLFTTGLLDSMSILHLVAFVESAIGRPIPSRQVRMENFRTVQAVCDAFRPEASQTGTEPEEEP